MNWAWFGYNEKNLYLGLKHRLTMTEEEKREQQKERNRRYYEKWKAKNPDKFRLNDEKQRMKKAVNIEKHFHISHVGFRVTIGTLDRFTLKTSYIDGKVTLPYTSQEYLKQMRKFILEYARNWVQNQDMWDKHKRIFIVDIPDFTERVKTKTNTISFQFNLLRVGEFEKKSLVDRWHELHKGLEPFCDDLYQAVKKAVEKDGFELTDRAGKTKD